MKLIWKIKNNADIMLALKYLKVNAEYLKIILDEESQFIKYIKTEPEYFCITYSDNLKIADSGFCWGEGDEDSISYLTSRGYIFKGEINLRKEKLEKLNGKFR